MIIAHEKVSGHGGRAIDYLPILNHIYIVNRLLNLILNLGGICLCSLKALKHSLSWFLYATHCHICLTANNHFKIIVISVDRAAESGSEELMLHRLNLL